MYRIVIMSQNILMTSPNIIIYLINHTHELFEAGRKSIRKKNMTLNYDGCRILYI